MTDGSLAGPSPLQVQLVASGRVALVETTGRVSGRAARTAVGFLEEPGGSIVVAASSASAHWARNLLAHPRCRVTIAARSFAAVAEPLARGEAIGAVRDLILKYGTPSESLGGGPVFRLQPVGEDTPDP